MIAPRRPFAIRSARPSVAAFLSALIAVGVVGGVTSLFQSRGQPWGELVAATAACPQSLSAAQRDVCVRQQVAVALATQLARQ